MSGEITLNSSRAEILRGAMSQLTALRRRAEVLPDRSESEAVIEAIEFYENSLPTFKNRLQLREWWGRAVADIKHEIAAAKFGWESEEAEAVFEAEDREFSKLYRALLTN